MTYSNLHTLVDSLASKLYTFNGHHIDPIRSSRAFTEIARGCDWLKSNPSAVSLVYDAEVYLCGHACPASVTISGDDIAGPMTCAISLIH